MKSRLSPCLVLALALLGALASAAQADFGLRELDATFTNQDGSVASQAGSHPFAYTVNLVQNTRPEPLNPEIGVVPDGESKDVVVRQIPGLVGDTTAVPRCSSADFLETGGGADPLCPSSTRLGTAHNVVGSPDTTLDSAVFNLVPAPGTAARLGFSAAGVLVTVDITLNESPPYNVIAKASNITQIAGFYASKLDIWGVPADPAHDAQRGGPSTAPQVPFLTSPRACQGPLPTSFEADSWQDPGLPYPFQETIFTHDDATPPNPLGFTGCAKLGFGPSIAAQPTSRAASSPSGLDFSLDVHDEGLRNPSGLAESDIRKAVVTLPEGFSPNPALAEGLLACSEAQLQVETAFSAPGEGCPNASKIGTVEVQTPLLEEDVNGSLYIAKPYENPFGSLIAFYLVIKNPTLGILVTQPLRVESDPLTGQLTTVAEDLPQLPFSHFKLHFREGTRSPLATPPGCGSYEAKATLTPWSGGEPITTGSAFQIITGPDAAPCPPAGLPPFRPGLTAGTLNNAAGHFSPFDVRLSRTDSEQEITRFSIKLPPGITGKLAGIPFCSDAAIAAAKARTGPHGGAEELASPSCPAASQIGRTLVGAGVGPSLAYAPGKVYLAGPHHGSAISLVAITAGVVGPFDLGTVVVREAFKINPETGEVFIDSTGSDPIPHIIKGIPVHLRDIRVYTDRPEFVLNPSGCERTSTASTMLGSGLDFASEADDRPVTVSTPFQAADCAALPFHPKLSLALVGGAKRGAHPKLVAKLKMNGIGEAAISSAQVTLPHSEFLDQAHIKTICTRVQFKAGGGNGEQCPAASVYGHAKAITPLLSEPLEGPLFLRSSEHQLPDLVAALHNGEINVDLVGRVDSVKGGGIRNTFESVPDAPVSSASFVFEGKGKGLLVNSTDLCKGTHRAKVSFIGHNGKSYDSKPALQVRCGKAKKNNKHSSKRLP